MKVCVIQARLGSSRLPGKVLLPIGSYPAVVLAAKRCSNLGMKVIVATSCHSSDDTLAALLAEQGVSVVRGPLDDVLQRFVIATKDLPDSAVIVRLTADNVFPDGAFINELGETLQQTGSDYVGTLSPADGLPYGLSAEAFTLSALRIADRQATTVFDREHVTPWLRRRLPQIPFRPKELSRDLSHLRCTIDSIDDYCQVAQVFSTFENPVSATWSELCKILEQNSPSPQIGKRSFGAKQAGAVVLGTAQLGLPWYGRTNAVGRPDSAAAVELIRMAVRHGVDCLDTARAYDQAERIVGEAVRPFGDRIKIVTKLSPLAELQEKATRDEVRASVDASVFRSCRELGVACLPVLLLHRWEHRTSHQCSVWERLLELKAEGVIQRLGASVSSPDEALAALRDEVVEHLQIPFNLLDHRWRAAGVDQLAARRGNVTIHARSVLLQGILVGRPELWPEMDGVDASHVVETLETLVRTLQRATRTDLCLAYVRAQSWIHSLVIGVESEAQFNEILQLFQSPALNAAEQDVVRRALPPMPETLLNPTLWPQK